MNRKHFLKNSIAGLSVLSIRPVMALSNKQKQPPKLDEKLVKEFVGVGHHNLNRIKEMLEEHPNLLYASLDQGKGDFEQAIEAAGHVGDKEIANYLISKGARPNIFVLTMLGKSSIVIPMLEAYPHLVFSNGVHGFTLLHHAKVGEASKMYDYLTDKGLQKTFIKIK